MNDDLKTAPLFRAHEWGWITFVLILGVTAYAVMPHDRHAIQDIIEPTWTCKTLNTTGPLRKGDGWVAYRLRECTDAQGESRLYGSYVEIYSFDELDLVPGKWQ